MKTTADFKTAPNPSKYEDNLKNMESFLNFSVITLKVFGLPVLIVSSWTVLVCPRIIYNTDHQQPFMQLFSYTGRVE